MKIYMKQLRLIILFSILSLSVTVRAMKEQSVSLDTPTGKINGKIGLPDAEKPPIVLLIAGSGPTDMDVRRLCDRCSGLDRSAERG